MNREHPVSVGEILTHVPRETSAGERGSAFCFNLPYWSGIIGSKVFVPICLQKGTCYVVTVLCLLFCCRDYVVVSLHKSFWKASAYENYSQTSVYFRNSSQMSSPPCLKCHISLAGDTREWFVLVIFDSHWYPTERERKDGLYEQSSKCDHWNAIEAFGLFSSFIGLIDFSSE